MTQQLFLELLIEQNIAALRTVGIDIKAEQLSDLSVLREVYAESLDLK
ncbi:hypothetical protein ACL02S_18005 [Nocardia sp. 004]